MDKTNPINPIGETNWRLVFKSLIKALIGNGYESKIIVLIDEYDNVLNYCRGKEQYEAILDVHVEFFKMLKTYRNDFQLLFATGVTRFGFLGLESGSNAFDDISMNENYCSILGYTAKDMERFHPRFEHLAEERMKEVKKNYNGYRFSTKCEYVYSPDSILKFMECGKLLDYWYHTGDPTILINEIREDPAGFAGRWDEETIEATEDELMQGGSANQDIELIPLMYETGYLTIKE
jgi:hypothetical protein